MSKTSRLSQKSLIMEYYKSRPNQDVKHVDSVDWALREWKEQTGTDLRDPDRAIRLLHQEGMLIQISKGVYNMIRPQ